MKQPRVISLSYKIRSDAHTRYERPAVMELTNTLGRFKLEQEFLTWWPEEHFRGAAEARAALEPFLHDWEVHAAIQDMPGVLTFAFAHAEVEEPPVQAEGGRTIRLEALAGLSLTATAKMTAIRGRYPEAPSWFRVTTEVETAYRRWRAYRDGREPLPSMAYLIFTIFVPQKGRSRSEAAKLFAVEERVLQTVSGLSSLRGGIDEARKFSAQDNTVPLADHERAWLEEAVRKLIYRLGEHAAGASLTQIRMEDLPQPAPVFSSNS